MTFPSPTFEDYLSAVHQAYQDLLAAPLRPASEHSIVPLSGGTYVFYEKNLRWSS